MKNRAKSKNDKAREEKISEFIASLIYQLKDWKPKASKSKSIFVSIFS